MAHARYVLDKKKKGYTRTGKCTPRHARAPTSAPTHKYDFFAGNNGYMNPPQCYVIRTLSALTNLRFVTASCYDSGTTNEPAFLPLKTLDLRILKRTNDNYVYRVKGTILNASPASYPERTESSQFEWL
jgi:hypothetical protein